MDLLARYGVYRMRVTHFGPGNYVCNARWGYVASKNRLAKVQNLELRLTLGTRKRRHAQARYGMRAFKEKILQQILSTMDHPLNCYVKLKLNSRQITRWEEITAINPLRRFKTVTVKVGYPDWKYKYRGAVWRRSYEYEEIERQRVIKYLRMVLGTHERKRDGPELKIISIRVFEEEVS